jgi:hypothetical protein
MLTRRRFLQTSGGGFGALALQHLLHGQDVHHAPKAQRVVQLFMNGGASPMDTFDYKPDLAKKHGQKVDFGIKTAPTSVPGAVMKSPFEFQRHGQCGRWVSSVFPRIARHVDDLAFLMAMQSKSNVHGPASYLQNTGFILPGFPCMGSWISYGLGTLSRDLPAFVVLPDPAGLPYNNAGNFSPGFLPAAHQGVVIRPSAPVPIANLRAPASATPESESDGLALVQSMNRDHLRDHPGDTRLEARIESYELAARMQLSAPEVLDVQREPDYIRRDYGLGEKEPAAFGRNCLVARRLLERGVRFVQVWSGAGGPTKNWDNHANIDKELPYIAHQVDGPISALLTDLKRRGMLEDTIVVWTTEFGRMPFTQGETGRDHNGGTFVSWLAGAGIKGGVAHGSSDEYAYQAAEGKTMGYDLHATILHLLGIDHERLAVRHNGIDRRLTDVHGHVIQEILA